MAGELDQAAEYLLAYEECSIGEHSGMGLETGRLGEPHSPLFNVDTSRKLLFNSGMTVSFYVDTEREPLNISNANAVPVITAIAGHFDGPEGWAGSASGDQLRAAVGQVALLDDGGRREGYWVSVSERLAELGDGARVLWWG